MTSDYSVVLLTHALALPATEVLLALRMFEDKLQSTRHLALITQASHGTVSLNFETSSLDAAFCLSEISGLNSVSWLSEIQRILKPGGVIVVHEANAPYNQAREALNRDLLLAGYVNVEVLEMSEDSSLPLLQNCDSSHHLMIRAEKPIWKIGSSFKIKGFGAMPQEGNLKENTSGSTRLNHDAVTESDSFTSLLPNLEGKDNLIDEDSLLEGEDINKPEPEKTNEDCKVNNVPRAPCKNCTCGRARLEGEGRRALTEDEVNNPQSACGNCGLGDAFRCGGCPYRGLAPFKLGEKITLPATFLTADVM